MPGLVYRVEFKKFIFKFADITQKIFIMKKLFTLFIALGFLYSVNAYAQAPYATIGLPDDMQISSGSVNIPVEVDFSLNEVCNFDFYIEFDDTYLNFTGLINQDPGFPGFIFADGPGSTSPLHVFWISFGGTPTSFQGKIFDLSFDYLGGDVEIAFVLPEDDPNNYTSVGNCMGDEFTNIEYSGTGAISLAPPVPLSNLAILLGFGLIVMIIVLKRGRFI